MLASDSPAGTGPRQAAIDDRAHHAAIEAAVRGHHGSTELASDVPSQGVGARITAIANVDTRLVNKAAAEAAAALAAAEPPPPPALPVFPPPADPSKRRFCECASTSECPCMSVR